MRPLSSAQTRGLALPHLYADPVTLHTYIKGGDEYDKPIKPRTLKYLLDQGLVVLDRERNPRLNDGTILDVMIPLPGGKKVPGVRVWNTDLGNLVLYTPSGSIISASESKAPARTRLATIKLRPGNCILVPHLLPGVREWREVRSITMDADSDPLWRVTTADDRGNGHPQDVTATATRRWAVR